MKIHEAAKIASETGQGMVLEHELKERGKHIDVIVPTNSYNCCIGISKEGSSELRRWNPSPEELTASDWLVVDPKE